MQSIPIPTKIDLQEGEDKNTAKIIIEPCYPGYGITLGNALRRVLLSSLPGAAITSFKAKNILHEYSTIENVKEDLVEISLNLKQIRFKIFSDQPVRLTLSAKGEKKVTTNDFHLSSDIQIANPNQHIATLTNKNAELEMEVIASSGRGYIPTENREELEVEMIAIDSLFSPIKKVSFNVENVRVGQMTNWDKLIIEIETDGTLTPRQSIHEATKYLIEHFNFIGTSTSVSENPQPIKEGKKSKDTIEEERPAEKEEEQKETISEEKKPKKRGRPRKIKKEE